MTIYEKVKAISLLQSVEEVLLSFNDTLERALKKAKGEKDEVQSRRASR
jgi:hypothetical protein